MIISIFYEPWHSHPLYSTSIMCTVITLAYHTLCYIPYTMLHLLNLISHLYSLSLYTYIYREPVYLKSSKQSIITEYKTGRISAEALIKKGVAFKNITEVLYTSLLLNMLYAYTPYTLPIKIPIYLLYVYTLSHLHIYLSKLILTHVSTYLYYTHTIHSPSRTHTYYTHKYILTPIYIVISVRAQIPPC